VKWKKKYGLEASKTVPRDLRRVYRLGYSALGIRGRHGTTKHWKARLSHEAVEASIHLIFIRLAIAKGNTVKLAARIFFSVKCKVNTVTTDGDTLPQLARYD